jgi:general secretion pathway protein G
VPSRIFQTSGLTLVELTVTMAILSILAVGVLPLSQMTYKRTKEVELRQNLRVIRKAIDEYKRMVDEGRIPKDGFSTGYPKDLNVLVEGVDLQGAAAQKEKFLRRIPKDPMTEDGEWGLRSYADEPESDAWGGQDVYDVYSKSDKQALDGTSYRDW